MFARSKLLLIESILGQCSANREFAIYSAPLSPLSLNRRLAVPQAANHYADQLGTFHLAYSMAHVPTSGRITQARTGADLPFGLVLSPEWRAAFWSEAEWQSTSIG